jgi:predicted Co/Zn/Cd cation transporter (cation efflux family)
MFDIRGSNPPGIALILAAVFMWWGFMNNSFTAITVGGVFAAIGIGLQVLYLRYRYGRAAKSRRTVAP